MEIKQKPQCSLCSKQRAHNSLMCAECRAAMDMRNAILGTFSPDSLAEFLDTMEREQVNSLRQLQNLAESRNAWQLTSLTKRLRTYERESGAGNTWPKLLVSLRSISDYTQKRRGELQNV